MKHVLLSFGLLAVVLAPVHAAGPSLSGPLTDDASTGISTSNTYTHAVSGGSAVAVNGVNFDLLDAGNTPPNFAWDTGANNKSQIASILNAWAPATGGVTGPGLIGLLSGFTYSGTGDTAPSNQTFTLSGLTNGTTYETRLYIRVWDTGGSGRPVAFTFTNGAEINTDVVGPEDRPGDVLGTGNQNQAYYVSYLYTAQGSEFLINTAIPDGSPAASGSFHMYGLTNQVIPEPTTAVCLALAGLVGVTRRRR